VTQCETDGFILEATTFEGYVVIDYAHVTRADAGMACLAVPASELASSARRLGRDTTRALIPPPGASADAARVRALELHAELRGAMREALGWANGVLAGDAAAELALRHAAAAFAAAVRNHVHEEHRSLEPILATVDAWGPQRCEQLDDQHRCEIVAVEDSDEAAFALDSPEDLARLVRQAVAAVLRCLRREERDILDPDLLTDNPVRTEQNTG
jgi:hypothetical protein